MSEASFRHREPSPDDPVVCGACGATLGNRRGLSNRKAVVKAEADHKPQCMERMDHQRKHRTLAGPCDEEAQTG